MFLICSSVGGHLCCLHFLVVVSDSGSKHGCVRIPVVGLYILYAYASSGLARSYSVISSVFSCLQSQRVDLHSLCIYIPTLGQHWFLFLVPPWCSPQPFLVLQVLAGYVITSEHVCSACHSSHCAQLGPKAFLGLFAVVGNSTAGCQFLGNLL
jgi:hypothetical protein